MCLITQLALFAQRERLMPEDYTDYDNRISTNGEPTIYIILLAVIVIGSIWFKISLDSSRKKEIKEQTTFLTNIRTTAFFEATKAIHTYNHNYGLTEYYKEVDGVVLIPKYAKCIILEYVPENHSFVKVKFEDFQIPLYVPRRILRTPDRIDK